MSLDHLRMSEISPTDTIVPMTESVSDFYLLQCPHCDGTVFVLSHEIRCRIFRHGVFRDTGQPIPPHSSKEDCDAWSAANRLYGCGKPFRVEWKETGWVALVCDYL